MTNLPWYLWVLIAFVAMYGIGFFAALFLFRNADAGEVFGLAIKWPITLVWMLFGNIQ